MTSANPNLPGDRPSPSLAAAISDPGLSRVVSRLIRTMERDSLVQDTLDELLQTLRVDRVVLYYFFRPWEGRVTAEALVDPSLSILGSTGPDACFNDEYADLYLAGRIRATPDILMADIHPCHRDFLRNLCVRANLVAPVLIPQGLWGLLIAHHCKAPRPWSEADVLIIRTAGHTLASAPSIQTIE